MMFAVRLSARLFVLGAALTAFFWGIGLLCYEIAGGGARARIAPDPLVHRQDDTDGRFDLAMDTACCAGVPGTVIATRFGAIEASEHSTSGHDRILKLARALEVSPTTGDLWVRYSDLVHRLYQKPTATIRALELAFLTQRREAKTMYWSAIQTINVWEDVSPTQRERAIAAIAELNDQLGFHEAEVLGHALATKPAAERQDIAARLRMKLHRAPNFLKQIGL